jgi:hypothetical protein
MPGGAFRPISGEEFWRASNDLPVGKSVAFAF